MSVAAVTHTGKAIQLAPGQVYRATCLDADLLEDTQAVEGNNDFLGQDRVRKAVQLALQMHHDGYNLFAVGPRGLGKKTMLLRHLRQVASSMPTPNDWCYLNNFDDPRRPQAMEFASGQAMEVRRSLLDFWRLMTESMAQAFDTESYFERIEGLKGALSRSQQKLLTELSQEGERQQVKLVLRTPGGYGFAPMNEAGEVMGVDEFNALPRKNQSQLRKAMTQMEGQLRSVSQVLSREEQLNRDRIRQLNQEVALGVLQPEWQKIRDRFRRHKQFVAYLDRMREDILNNIELVLNQEDQQDAVATVSSDSLVPSRYQVNVIVSHEPGRGAPLIIEDLPTHYNLLGHVEQVTYMGTVATDFTLIRPGALHRANGGFLLLEAEQVLEQPYAWQGLKRALSAKHMRFSSLEQMLTLTGTLSLEADPIPLQVKIILFGDRETFYLLKDFDPELSDYFKVMADFATSMDRTAVNEWAYVRYLADLVVDKGLKHLERSAVERLIEETARWSEDQDRLALHASSVVDLLREADHAARRKRSRLIQVRHVEEAISSMEYRHAALHDELLRGLAQGEHLFSTEGAVLGQVHGLSVLDDAGYSFGLPSRITATTHHGGGEILDIEREVDLGGEIHSKGVLILQNYLKSLFGQKHPLRFSGSLVFEQSYGPVDGDSASLAELCALLSSMSGIPVLQRLAVTGSVNQHGEVQPIGGVNQKIEGFFKACQIHGSLKDCGVLIPAQNVKHLMLRSEVRQAIQDGLFHIYAVRRVEEAVELLLQCPAGTPVENQTASFATGTVYAAIEDRLEQWRLSERKDDDEEAE